MNGQILGIVFNGIFVHLALTVHQPWGLHDALKVWWKFLRHHWISYSGAYLNDDVQRPQTVPAK